MDVIFIYKKIDQENTGSFWGHKLTAKALDFKTFIL
jgi:hypothetical protein